MLKIINRKIVQNSEEVSIQCRMDDGSLWEKTAARYPTKEAVSRVSWVMLEPPFSEHETEINKVVK